MSSRSQAQITCTERHSTIFATALWELRIRFWLFVGTIAGPLKRNKVFFFAGFDQHIFHVPDVVEFLDGSSRVVPQAGAGPATPGDYEPTDQALVSAAAAGLTSLAGEYPAAQIGNSSYGKLDINLTPRQQLTLRVNTTRYWGANNVFLDPSS